MRTTDREWLETWERTEESHRQAIALMPRNRNVIRTVVRVAFWGGILAIGYLIPPLWWN